MIKFRILMFIKARLLFNKIYLPMTILPIVTITLGFLNFVLVFPFMPQFIINSISSLLYRLRHLFWAGVLLLSFEIYHSYIKFTIHFPFVTMQDVKIPEKITIMLAKHFSFQRNFYLSFVSLIMIL